MDEIMKELPLTGCCSLRLILNTCLYTVLANHGNTRLQLAYMVDVD